MAVHFGWSSMKAWFLCLDSRRVQASTRFQVMPTRSLHILFSEQRRKESDDYCAGNEVLTADEKKRRSNLLAISGADLARHGETNLSSNRAVAVDGSTKRSTK